MKMYTQEIVDKLYGFRNSRKYAKDRVISANDHIGRGSDSLLQDEELGNSPGGELTTQS